MPQLLKSEKLEAIMRLTAHTTLIPTFTVETTITRMSLHTVATTIDGARAVIRSCLSPVQRTKASPAIAKMAGLATAITKAASLMVTRLTMVSPALARPITTFPIHTVTTVTPLVTVLNMTTHPVANPATQLPPTVSTMIHSHLIAGTMARSLLIVVMSLANIAMTAMMTTICRPRLTSGKSERLGKL